MDIDNDIRLLCHCQAPGNHSTPTQTHTSLFISSSSAVVLHKTVVGLFVLVKSTASWKKCSEKIKACINFLYIWQRHLLKSKMISLCNYTFRARLYIYMVHCLLYNCVKLNKGTKNVLGYWSEWHSNIHKIKYSRSSQFHGRDAFWGNPYIESVD